VSAVAPARAAIVWLANSRWRNAVAAVAGAVGLVLLGQALAFGGGTCALLCNPWVAAPLGALMGVLWFGGAPRHRTG
jgi:hypothetical protein